MACASFYFFSIKDTLQHPMLVDGWPIDLNLVVSYFVLVFFFGFSRKAQDDRDTGEAGTFYTGPGMTVDGRPTRCAGSYTHDPFVLCKDY